MGCRASCSIAVLLAVMAGEAAAQNVRGRAVDDATRAPITDVSVTLTSPSGDTLGTSATRADGFFELRVPGPGRYLVRLERLGYAGERREITVADADLTVPAFVLKTAAVPLPAVDAGAARRTDAAAVGFRRSSHVMAGTQLARLERQAATTAAAVRGLPNVRMRTIPTFQNREQRTLYNYVCVESTRRMVAIPDAHRSQPACEPVVVVLNGVVGGDAHEIIRSFSLVEIESIELLQPAEAGVLYGLDASAFGALVIWLRGFGPHRSEERNRGGP